MNAQTKILRIQLPQQRTVWLSLLDVLASPTHRNKCMIFSQTCLHGFNGFSQLFSIYRQWRTLVSPNCSVSADTARQWFLLIVQYLQTLEDIRFFQLFSLSRQCTTMVSPNCPVSACRQWFPSIVHSLQTMVDNGFLQLSTICRQWRSIVSLNCPLSADNAGQWFPSIVPSLQKCRTLVSLNCPISTDNAG